MNLIYIREGEPEMQRLKVTDTKTGQEWIQNNQPHSWADLCLHIMKRHKEFSLTYCDIECICKGFSWNLKNELEEVYYMLDECGRWEYIPEEYKIEEVG
jgi:hypothetical protein